MTHPITPPLELVQKWRDSWSPSRHGEFSFYIATQAAQWGADQELEACCSEVSWNGNKALAAELRTRRRPKPPSLKEQALTALHAVATGANDIREQHQDLDNIRRALEALPND